LLKWTRADTIIAGVSIANVIIADVIIADGIIADVTRAQVLGVLSKTKPTVRWDDVAGQAEAKQARRRPAGLALPRQSAPIAHRSGSSPAGQSPTASGVTGLRPNAPPGQPSLRSASRPQALQEAVVLPMKFPQLFSKEAKIDEGRTLSLCTAMSCPYRGFIPKATGLLLFFWRVPNCSQNQTVVSEAQHVLSEFKYDQGRPTVLILKTG
jgi:hypothetical protein